MLKIKTIVKCVINCRDITLVHQGNYTTSGRTEIPLAEIFLSVLVFTDVGPFPVMYFPHINDTGMFRQVSKEPFVLSCVAFVSFDELADFRRELWQKTWFKYDRCLLQDLGSIFAHGWWPVSCALKIHFNIFNLNILLSHLMSSITFLVK